MSRDVNSVTATARLRISHNAHMTAALLTTSAAARTRGHGASSTVDLFMGHGWPVRARVQLNDMLFFE